MEHSKTGLLMGAMVIYRISLHSIQDILLLARPRNRKWLRIFKSQWTMELYTAYIRVTSSLTVDSTLFRIQYMLDLVVCDFPYSNANPKSHCVGEILHLGWLKHVESLQIVGCLPQGGAPPSYKLVYSPINYRYVYWYHKS